jgi:FHS family L-fucose permease-like MFS transporter
MGPALGGLLIFGGTNSSETNKFASMTLPYMIIGTMVLLVAIMFMFTKMPEIHEGEYDDHGDKGRYKDLLRFPHFRFAVTSQFLYVAAQTGINSFFINYVTETMPRFSNEKAAYLLSLGFVFFMVGRFSGSLLMSWFKPNQMLALYAVINVVAMVFVVLGLGWLSLIALYLTYFCMSIMFPTIFALGIKDLGGLTKKGSSIIIMTIVGGAICPIFMGWIADVSNMALGFIVPLFCFGFIIYFGLRGYKVKSL